MRFGAAAHLFDWASALETGAYGVHVGRDLGEGNAADPAINLGDPVWHDLLAGNGLLWHGRSRALRSSDGRGLRFGCSLRSGMSPQQRQ